MSRPNKSIPQQGRIYFWKYKTDGWLGSEWHLTADLPGCDFLSRLFVTMQKSEFPYETALSITPVTQNILRIPNYNSPFKNIEELRFSFQPSAPRHYDWIIVDNKNSVEIIFGKAMLTEWINAVQNIKSGVENTLIGLHEDYSIFVWHMPK